MTGTILVNTAQLTLTDSDAMRFGPEDTDIKNKLKMQWAQSIPDTAISVLEKKSYGIDKQYELRGAFLDERQVSELLGDLAELTKLREVIYNGKQ